MIAGRTRRIVLIVLEVLLALGAVGGGIGLIVTNGLGAPLELLEGSPFGSYLIPGLALLVLVGGSAILAAILVWRKHELGALASVVAGVMVMGFEVVEKIVVGSPMTSALVQQIIWFAVGLLIAALALPALVAQRRMRTLGSHGNLR